MNKNPFLALLLVSFFSANPIAHAADLAVEKSVVSESTAAPDISQYTHYELRGVASAKINALIQGWALGNQNATSNDQNFRLRRAEFKLSGTIANAPRYLFMVDPAKLIPPPNGKTIPAENMVQDFALSYSVLPGFEVTAGQFKIPTTAEGLDSASDLPLPERSVVGRAFGDKREMGIKLGYKTALWNAASMLSSGRPFYTNGTGAFNDLDTRVEVTPVKDLAIGSFVVIGNNFDYSKKGRWGLNGRYNWQHAVLRAEYSLGKDGAVHSQGVTSEVGYWLSENLEPVGRFEAFSPNQAFDTAAKAETLGVNYYFKNYFTKLQVAGSLLQDMAAVNGSPTVVKGVTNQELTLQLQAAI